MRKLFIAIATALSLMSASAEVTYKYDESTKTLTISGEGISNNTGTDMWEEDYNAPAWSKLKNDVEKVVVNEGITAIGNHAFISFEKLKEVQLPSTVETIGVAAFGGCYALANINMPENLKEFGAETFFDCKSLESFVVPKGVSELPANMFQNCESLKTIDLGNVKEFGESAFRNCGFESFEIPEGVKTLSEDIFFGCSDLKKMDIPASVETIEYGAFYYCSGIDTINFLGETFPELTGGNVFATTNDLVIKINCNAYGKDAIDAIEENGGAYNTTVIPSWPYGTEISATRLKNNLSIIPVDCDNNIYKLSFDLENGYKLTWEGDYDFDEDELNNPEIEVDLSEPVKITANVEYDYGGGGGGIITPDTEIDFDYIVYGLGDVVMTELSKTSEEATYKLVATPKEGAEFLYWEMYYDDELLTEDQITSPEIEITLTETDYIVAVFTPSPYCGINGGDNITWSIKNDTLYLTGEGEMENYKLDSYKPFLVEQENSPFSYIKVGEGVTTIGNFAFSSLDGIKEIYLPTTLTTVGVYPFMDLDEVEKVYFKGSTPPSFFGGSANLDWIFYQMEDPEVIVPCNALDTYKETLESTGVTVICSDDSEDDDPENPSKDDDIVFDPANVCGADGDGSNILWAFDEATGTLYLKGTGRMEDYTSRKKYPWKGLDVKNLIVSDGITTIGQYAFYEVSTLESVSLPTSLDTIGYYSFASTSGLKDLILPEGLLYIDGSGFSGTGATNIVFPSTLNSIGDYSFRYCKSKSVVIPASVEYIGNGAFYSSGELESIVFERATPATTGGNTIVSSATNTTGKLVKLIVPCEAVAAYKEHSGYQAEYVQGEFPYSLTLSQNTDSYVGSDLGGRPLIQQWPDCETGEAIVTVFVKQPYKFSHWEATGVTLTDEQAKSNPITFTVDADCKLTAVFADMTNNNDVESENIVVLVDGNRIAINRDEFVIMDVLGRDVTASNGSLTTGVYVVKCEGKTFKAVVK